MHSVNDSPPRHLADLYDRAARCYGGMPAFATRRNKDAWEPLSYEELYQRGEALAAGLMERGLGFQEAIGVFSDNRVEWIVADCAVQLCGAVNVPRGSDVTDGELAFILRHAELHLCFVENVALLERLERVAGKEGLSVEGIVFQVGEENGGAGDEAGLLSLVALEAAGRQRLAREASVKQELADRGKRLTADERFTLIYTSGTTGEPKGVPLTHGNMLSQIRNIPMPISWRDRVLSILPIWHIYERVLEMITIHRGACTYYSNIRSFGDDLLAVEPTFMASAPRLWESLHGRILKKIAKAHPVRRGLFHTACFFARHYFRSVTWFRGDTLRESKPNRTKDAGRSILEALRWILVLPLHGFFNAAVLEQVRLSVGGCLRGTISGGGALPPHIDAFFNEIGVVVLEGYGLTETCPVLAVRCLDCRVCSTVGQPIPETEVRIVDLDSEAVLYPDDSRADGGRMRKGEIRVRGPQVMSGYYKNETATGTAFDAEGWFRTGDLAWITWNDCLRILGRSKETIVLSSGENLEPGPIEMRLRESPLIDQCMVVGQDQRCIGALIVAAPEAHKQSADAAELKQLLAGEVRSLISAANGFKSHERIRDIAVIEEPFEVGREMTNLFKLKRHVVSERYAAQIKTLFSASNDD